MSPSARKGADFEEGFHLDYTMHSENIFTEKNIKAEEWHTHKHCLILNEYFTWSTRRCGERCQKKINCMQKEPGNEETCISDNDLDQILQKLELCGHMCTVDCKKLRKTQSKEGNYEIIAVINKRIVGKCKLCGDNSCKKKLIPFSK